MDCRVKPGNDDGGPGEPLLLRAADQAEQRRQEAIKAKAEADRVALQERAAAEKRQIIERELALARKRMRQGATVSPTA